MSEKLKATDAMAWVQRMNNIRNRAVEIVNTEVMFICEITITPAPTMMDDLVIKWHKKLYYAFFSAVKYTDGVDD